MVNSTHQHHPDESVDVLHVEDTERGVRRAREAFAATDRETTLHVVDDVDDAVDFLRRRGQHDAAPRPNLVLLDLNPPERDGHEVLEAIEGMPQLRRLPVIALMNPNGCKDIATRHPMHVNAYVPKPPTLEAFVSLVTALEAFWLEHAQLPPSSA